VWRDDGKFRMSAPIAACVLAGPECRLIVGRAARTLVWWLRRGGGGTSPAGGFNLESLFGAALGLQTRSGNQATWS